MCIVLGEFLLLWSRRKPAAPATYIVTGEAEVHMTGKLDIGELASLGLGNVGIGPLNVNSVLDTVDFVRKAWASFGVPSNFAPTVDLEELDKRITDLKAVEQWLTVNLNLLQGAIQALEIQRGTIATLKAFGAPVASMAQAGRAAAGATGAAPFPWPASVVPTEGAAAPSPQPAPAAAMPSAASAEAQESAAPASTTGKSARRAPRREAAADAQPAPAFAEPGLSPTAWWNMLQNQFNQVAATALSGVGLAAPQGADAASKPQAATRTAAAGKTARTGAPKPRKRATTARKATGRRTRGPGPAR